MAERPAPTSRAERHLVVAGGGFAGIWAAAAAARARAERNLDPTRFRITVVTQSPNLEIRPRLYEALLPEMAIPISSIVGPAGIEVEIGRVTNIDKDARQIQVMQRGTKQLSYDALVLATGSQLSPAPIFKTPVFDIDKLSGATRLQVHLRGLGSRPGRSGRYTMVIVGAGFTGIELATELPTRLAAIQAPADEIKIVLIDRAAAVGSELGPGPRPIIEKALRDLRIDVRLGVEIATADAKSVTLSSGAVIDTNTIIWTAGMRANLLGALIGNVDSLGRVVVDDNLQVVGTENIFAAGDVACAEADAGRKALQSCQHAMNLGRFAGHNAATALLGGEPLVYRQPFYVTCLDLGAAGAVLTTGWDREVKLDGAQAKAVKERINRVLIYPPQNDASKLLAAAAPIVADPIAATARLLE